MAICFSVSECLVELVASTHACLWLVPRAVLHHVGEGVLWFIEEDPFSQALLMGMLITTVVVCARAYREDEAVRRQRHAWLDDAMRQARHVEMLLAATADVDESRAC